MINAKELRHGSWIADRGGKQWQIDCWETPTKVAAKAPTGTIDGFEFVGHPLTEDVEYLQPIPLTPEVLEACGLKNLQQKHNIIYGVPYSIVGTWGKDGLEIDFNRIGDISIKKLFGVSIRIDGVKLKYLHQLQNILFDLCGQELGYKPKV